jgi:hypothetical protein
VRPGLEHPRVARGEPLVDDYLDLSARLTNSVFCSLGKARLMITR